MSARFPMAVVVVGSPLTVTIEGATAVVAAEDFVGGLATDDRVQAALLGDRLVVFAKAGGFTAPYAEQVGTIVVSGNGTAASTATVTFRAGLFGVAPIVFAGTVGVGTISLSGSASSITTSSCTMSLYRNDGGVYSSTYTVPWRAVQMVSGAAAGFVGG